MRHSAPRLQLAVQVFEGVARCPGRFAPRSESIGQVLAHLVDMRVRVVVNIEKYRGIPENGMPHVGNRSRCASNWTEPTSVMGLCGAGPRRRPSSASASRCVGVSGNAGACAISSFAASSWSALALMPPASLSASRKLGQCRFHASIAARLVGGG